MKPTYFKFGSWSISILHYSLYYWDQREVVFLRSIRAHKDQLAHYYGYESDRKRMHNFWSERIEKDPRCIFTYGEEHNRNFKNVNVFLDRNLPKIQNASKVEILKIFQRYWHLLFLAEPIGDINHEIDEIYTERVVPQLKRILGERREDESLTGVLIQLTTPSEVLPTQQEELEFLKLVEKFSKKNHGAVSDYLTKHLMKYRWISVWYDNQPWTYADVLTRFHSEKGKRDRIKRINRLMFLSKQNKTIASRLEKKLGLRGRLLQDVRVFRYFTHIRNKIDLDTGYLVHKARPLYEKIASLLSISFDELRFLTPDEIQLGLKGKIASAVLRRRIQRRRVFAVQVFTGKRQKILVGKAAKRFIQKVQRGTGAQPISRLVNKQTDEVIGIGASTGFARGRARVISSISQLHTMKEGEILIVPSTSVDFVIAMKKSAAVVTEVGGITCHAAVVSRELGKPCVVNTGIATKIFKTGDLIEVSATDGIVRKVKK